MKRYLPFILPFTAVVLGGLVVMAIMSLAGRRTPPTEVPWVPFDQLDITQPYVRTSGMAHYGVVTERIVPGNLIRAQDNSWLFPLTAPYDTEQGAIQVMVKSPVPPEDLVTYELMTVEGWLSRATPEEVPFEIEVKMSRSSGYYFADEMMLLDVVVQEEGLDSRAEGAAE